MKKNNKKKGFTIVELVIVIAVIAILAAVMIPTFSGVIGKANESAAMQKAAAAWKDAYAVALSDGTITANETVDVGDFTFKFSTANSGDAETTEVPSGFGYTKATVTNGKVTLS